MFKNYIDVKNYLDRLGMFRMKAGQDRVIQALKKLDLFPLPLQAVQIVGTNGKGSTSTFLSSIAEEHGLKVGLFTSPHFVSVKERILINNSQVSDKIWLECANKVYEASDDLTYFEFVSVLAVLVYKECNCDIVFFEAGLGGKFDATTAFEVPITVFTPFALDHCQILGNSLLEIARDKAQAMGTWTKCAISAGQEIEARKELKNRAKSLSIPLSFIEKKIDDSIKISLCGEHQRYNAALALSSYKEIAKYFGFECIEEKLLQGIEKAFIAGRLQIIQGQNSPIENIEIILDGGHNLQGLEAVKNYFEKEDKALDYILFSCLEDKEIEEMAEIIKALIIRNKREIKLLIPSISNNPRALSSNLLAKYFENTKNLEILPYKNLDECIKYLHNRENKEENRLLICGSLYLLAEFYTQYPQFLSR